eukprot:2193511-Alexandrium_andersonii.AAC.1
MRARTGVRGGSGSCRARGGTDTWRLVRRGVHGCANAGAPHCACVHRCGIAVVHVHENARMPARRSL